MPLDTDKFFAFARERYQIYLNKQSGAPPPWTEDAILHKHRFCNVFREDDKTTRWFRINVREPIGAHAKEQVRAAVAFRLLNRIETGAAIQDLLMPGEWDLSKFKRRLRKRVEAGEKILSPAYMILTPEGMDKVEGIASVLKELEPELDKIVLGIQREMSIEYTTRRLQEINFIGSFMAYEMATDLRHTPLLCNAIDVNTWANPGPGAARGLLRIDPKLKGGRNSVQGVRAMINMMREISIKSDYKKNWPEEWPRWEMREVEHTLCEFDKYERARVDGKMPKRRYP